jgi:hypothetical protein
LLLLLLLFFFPRKIKKDPSSGPTLCAIAFDFVLRALLISRENQ